MIATACCLLLLINAGVLDGIGVLGCLNSADATGLSTAP